MAAHGKPCDLPVEQKRQCIYLNVNHRRNHMKIVWKGIGICIACFFGLGIVANIVNPPPRTIRAEEKYNCRGCPAEGSTPASTTIAAPTKTAIDNCSPGFYASLTGMKLYYASYDPKYSVSEFDCETIYVNAGDITSTAPELACGFTYGVESEMRETLRKGNVRSLWCSAGLLRGTTKIAVQ